MDSPKKFFTPVVRSVLCGLIGLTSVYAMASNSQREVIEGTRLQNYEQELRRIFPQSTRIEEYSFLPQEWGGISLMGLIGRLVGDRAQAPFEAINTRRYLYRAYSRNEIVGIGHGSTINAAEKPLDLYVFYNPDTSIKDIRIDRAPSTVVDRLAEGGYLQQFLNRPSSDFSVQIGRRGRVTNWGQFSSQARRPSDQELRTYYDRILRSMRFNTAFVEIAYFVSQNPLDDSGTTTAQGPTGGR